MCRNISIQAVDDGQASKVGSRADAYSDIVLVACNQAALSGIRNCIIAVLASGPPVVEGARHELGSLRGLQGVLISRTPPAVI